MIALDDLAAAPNALAPHYSRFRVAERMLLTGHSHQAWPDVAREGQIEAFDDAADLVDGKWDRAFAKADEVRAAVRGWLDDPGGEIALGASTHDLVIRFLSALDLAGRPRLVTSDGEFHTLRRQLARLDEAGVDVVWVDAQPPDTLAERMADAVDDRTAAVLVSAVLYESARIVPHLDGLAEACGRRGVELLVDAYHALGVVPMPIHEMGLSDAWIVGGGYKYLQLGEGNCFLRLPEHAERIRPVVTGWYAAFDTLADEGGGVRPGGAGGPGGADPPGDAYAPRGAGRTGGAGDLRSGLVRRPGDVQYGRGAQRFAGATYDPTSHYRAARVVRFFADHGLSAELLRRSYLHQLEVLTRAFDELDAPDVVITRDRATPLTDFGGFLALRSSNAQRLQQALRARGVSTDSRGQVLRLGPAPYLADAQLEAAVAALGGVLRAGA